LTRHCHAAALKAKHLTHARSSHPIDDDVEELTSEPLDGIAQPDAGARPKLDLCSELQHMGFSEEEASRASKQNRTIDGALEWLLKDHNEAFTQANWAPAGNRRLEDAVGNIDGASAASTLFRVSTSESVDNQANRPIRDLPARAHPVEDEKAASKRIANTKGRFVALPTRGGGNLEPPGETVVEQLLYLGFDQAQCETAAKQCQSLEVAVEWLSSQRATVQL
jgi:hypothetical protein